MSLPNVSLFWYLPRPKKFSGKLRKLITATAGAHEVIKRTGLHQLWKGPNKEITIKLFAAGRFHILGEGWDGIMRRESMAKGFGND